MTSFLTETFPDRDAALKGRRISASRAAGILGKSPWASPYSVWAEITGRIPDSDANPIRFRVGHALEGLIGELYEEHTLREVFPERQDTIQVHPIYPYITCTLDFTVVDYQKGKGCLNAKTANVQKADDWETSCPEHYWVQAQHEMLVTGRTWGSLAVLVGNSSFRWIDIEMDEGFQQEVMLPRYHQFWACVQNDVPPPVDWHPATTEAIDAQWPHESCGAALELPPDFAAVDENIVTYEAESAKAQRIVTGCKNIVKQYMGEAEIAFLPGVAKYTWKVQRTANNGLARIFRRSPLQ